MLNIWYNFNGDCMKKIFILLSIVLVLTGCTTAKKKEEKKEDILDDIQIDDSLANYVCTINNEDNKEYKLIGKYVIYLDNNDVTNINSVEIIESDNNNTLDYFESYYLSNYDKIANYGGYEYNIDKEEDKLIINVKINYNEFNIESYVTDYPDSISIFSEDFKLKEDKLLEKYEKQNIICEKK